MNLTTSIEGVNLLKSGNTEVKTIDGQVMYWVSSTGNLLDIPLGEPVVLTIRTETRGGKELQIIESFNNVGATPSLPKTAVASTPAVEAPVKAKKEVTRASFGGDFQKPWLPEEAQRVATLNILVAVLGSPGYAQECVGHNSNEVDAIMRRGFTQALTLYNQAVKAVE